MRILGLDFETTGLLPTADKVIEVGAVVWDTDKHTPIQLASFYVDWKLTELDPEVTKITGIDLKVLHDWGLTPAEALSVIINLMERSDAVCAHNGNIFDKLFLLNWCAQASKDFPDKLWMDTRDDLEIDERITTRKLTHLAAEHGFLNPFAHRAVFDVLTMFKIMEQYPLERTLELAQQPIICLQVFVSFNDKDLAKERGYRWFGPSKMWWKPFKECKIAAEQEHWKSKGVKYRVVERPE